MTKKVSVFRYVRYKQCSGRTILITPHFLVTFRKIDSEPNAIPDSLFGFIHLFYFEEVGGLSSNIFLRSLPKI